MRLPGELDLIAAIADDLAAGIWVATVPDGRFAYANRAFEEIMGVGALPDVAVGQYAEPYGIYDREGALYREDRLPFVRALLTRATVVVDDIVIHRRDGRRVYVRATGRPMFDAKGEMTHIAIAFFDITREVEAERARAAAEELLRRVVANAPIVLYAIDRNGTVTFSEGSGLETLGIRSSDVLGKSAFGMYPDAPVIEESCRRALAGETVTFTAELPPHVFENRLAPLRNDAGEITGAIGVSTDVTARRRAELQLVQAERLASVGMLAAGVAHEINNPLAYVTANLDLVAQRIAQKLATEPTDLIRTLEPMIEDARVGAGRVRDIVRGLKVFSRGSEGTHRPIDLRAALDTAIGLSRNEVRHRAQLVLDIEPVPPVLGDEGRAGQLFLNLLINAAQSIAEGSADKNTIGVKVRSDRDGWVHVEISDTGAGIGADALPRIFDPFFTTKPVGVGTGLGLSICHAIVTDLGGRIEVESEVGRGSTFRVVLRATDEAPAVEATHPSGERDHRQERGRVLVVDDEASILKVVQTMLAHAYDVTAETRADVALERICNGERFDAILCDLMMPEMTGIELYERLLGVAPDQAERMIFVTGGAFTAKARAFLDGARHPTLEKPFDVDTLTERVRALIAQTAANAASTIARASSST